MSRSNSHPKIVLIIGPTAVGKSSIIDRALKDVPKLHDLITYTTRPPRGGESEGHPYHFTNEEHFKKLIADGFFIEWANVHGRLYGTPRKPVLEAHARGETVIADVDVQGAKKLLLEFPDAVTIFLEPPSIEALRQRFIKRGVTNEADLAKRLESAKIELAQAQDFDHVLVNDDFDSCYLQVRKIIEILVKNQ